MPSGPASFDFGVAIALEDERVAIGAHGDGVGGATYLFERSAEVWTEVARIVPNELVDNMLFGYSVGLEGDRVVASAPTDEDPPDSGSVYVYRILP